MKDSPGRVLAALSGQDGVVVVRKVFVRWLGGIPAAVLLDQVLWRRSKTDGPFPATDREWQDALCLSRSDIEGARRTLVSRGLIQAERKGVPARMHYDVEIDAVAAAFLAWLDGHGADVAQTSVQDSANLTAGSRKLSVNISEVKANTPSGAGDDVMAPDGMEPDVFFRSARENPGGRGIGVIIGTVGERTLGVAEMADSALRSAFVRTIPRAQAAPFIRYVEDVVARGASVDDVLQTWHDLVDDPAERKYLTPVNAGDRLRAAWEAKVTASDDAGVVW